MMTSKEIEQRLIDKVITYTAACKRLRCASVEEADMRRTSLSMVDMLSAAMERAKLEEQACDAESWLYTLADMLIDARDLESRAQDEAKD